VIGTANGQDSTNIHYSQINNEYQVIQNCAPIDPSSQRPSTWNDERDGTWHPTIDGFIVKGDGQNYSRCQQQPVDYVKWDSLRLPNQDEGEAPAFVRGGPMIDPQGRTRVPYGFATDRWADLGNLSVYRHDNGADPYELFNFFIAQQEIGHIFDYYRRNRNGFSVRVATGRNLWRFNEKMRDGAKGLGLLANIYRDFFLEIGFDFDTAWSQMASHSTTSCAWRPVRRPDLTTASTRVISCCARTTALSGSPAPRGSSCPTAPPATSVTWAGAAS
jgi:hypothetical protein